MYFQYTEKEIEYLKSKDKKLGQLIEERGMIQREVTPDLFSSLVNNIVSQQISGKAAVTVWERLIDVAGTIEPQTIYNLDNDMIQQCGMSHRKVEYIKEIAEHVHTGKLDLRSLHSLDDDALSKRLSSIRGIGKWTAEMLMLFSMQRMDIVSFDDLAIQRGMRMVYRHREITKKLFNKYKKRYSPYGSVASLYLWSVAGGECPGYSDPGIRKASKK